MADLEYKIKISSDDAGAKAAQASTKELSSEMQKQIEASKLTGKAEKALGQEGESLTEKKRGLIAQLKILRHELPGLGEAIHLVKHPAVALAIAIGTVIEKFREYIQHVREAAAEVEPFENITASFGKFRTVAQQSKNEAAEFARQLAKIASEAHNADTTFKATIDAIESETKRTEELRHARTGLAEASIKLFEAQGGSPIEAGRRRSALQETAGSADRAGALRAGGLKYFALLGRISQTQAEQGTAAAGLPGMEAGTAEARKLQLASDKLSDATIELANKQIATLKQKKIEMEVPMLRAGNEQKIAETAAAIAEKQQEIDSASAEKLRAAARTKLAEEQEADAKAKIADHAKRLLELTAERDATAERLNADFRAGKTLNSLQGATLRTEQQASEITTGRSAVEGFIGVQRELASRREHGQDESDLLRKRDELIRTMKDIHVELGNGLDAILQTIRGVNNRIDNIQ